MFSSKPFILPDTFLGNLVPVSILVVIGIVWTSLDNKSKNNQNSLMVSLPLIHLLLRQI